MQKTSFLPILLDILILCLCTMRVRYSDILPGMYYLSLGVELYKKKIKTL